MRAYEILNVLRRRWYIAAVLLAVTAGAGWRVDHERPMYQATAVALLVPPATSIAPNTVAAVTPSVAETGVLVDQAMSDSALVPQLRSAGVTGDFSIAPHNSGTVQTPRYTLPNEELTVSAADPASAVQSLTVLMSLYTEKLRELQAQAGVAARDQITSQVLVPAAAAPVRGSKSRGLAGVAMLGLGAGVLVPLWWERFARWRGARRPNPRPALS